MKKIIKIFLPVFLFTASTVIAHANNPETITIYGTVIDEQKEPIIGANIYIIDTQKGKSTNTDGEFEIANVPTDAQVKISYVGLSAQTIPANELKDKIITLKSDNELDETIVTACKTDTKEELNASELKPINGECWPTKCKDGYILTNKQNFEYNYLLNKCIEEYEEEEETLEETL